MHKKVPLVSIILVVHYGKQWLDNCITSFLKQIYPKIEIIMVDNNSNDGSVEFVKTKFPMVIIIKKTTNEGFSVAANAGIKIAKGKYFFITNQDVIADKNCISFLVSEMEKDSTIGACQGSIYQYDKPHQLQSRGLFFNISGILMDIKDILNTIPNHPVEVFAAVGPCSLVRKSLIQKIGGLDELFFMYFEEVDLCWRIWLSGSNVISIPQARLYHKGGGNKLHKNSFLLYLSLRNRIASYIKNAELKTLISSIFVQLTIYTTGFIVFLFKGKWNECKSIISAWFWNIENLPSLLKSRSFIQKTRRISDRDLFARVGTSIPLSRLLFVGGFKKYK